MYVLRRSKFAVYMCIWYYTAFLVPTSQMHYYRPVIVLLIFVKCLSYKSLIGGFAILLFNIYTIFTFKMKSYLNLLNDKMVGDLTPKA